MMGLSGRYTVQPSPLDEDALQIELAEKNYSPQDYARTLAERKAQAMAVTMSLAGEVTTLIIGSDTIVDLDGSISEFDFNTESYRSTLIYSSW
jgi:predicted house-cleaning NTP pyrophosphatase (Maf/HAM1 superfamily)